MDNATKKQKKKPLYSIHPFNYSAGSGHKCNDDGDLSDYSRLDDLFICPESGK